MLHLSEDKNPWSSTPPAAKLVDFYFSHGRTWLIYSIDFLSYIGMADETTVFCKFLASHKWDTHYAAIMGWVRCCIPFSPLHAAIRCL